MDLLLMCLFGLFTLIFSFTIFLLFKQNPIMKSLFVFMLLISLWQFHVAVLFADYYLPKKIIDYLFRLFQIGPALVPPTFLYVFYTVIKNSDEQVETKWYKHILNKKIIISYYGLSLVYYGYQWSHQLVKTIQYIKYSSFIQFWYPIYGKMSFLNSIYVALLFISIVIGIFVVKEIGNKFNHFLKEFVIFTIILSVLGILDYSKSLALLSSVFAATTFSIGMFVTIIRYQLKIIENMKKTLENSFKMEVIGQMAAGVAHEIRNPLTSIRGFIQLLEKENLGKRSYFEIILSELDRINSIISEFLTVAKPQIETFETHDIHILLDDVVALLNTQAIMLNIQILSEFELITPYLKCDKNHLKQVFINILKNAVDSMENGGNIKIKVKSNDDKTMAISFIDQGHGISKERIKKLGEPFYTTKEKGVGLGMMVSYRIIEAHHGKIQIESEVGIGTIVTVILPSVDKAGTS